jgi:hypothetical protein
MLGIGGLEAGLPLWRPVFDPITICVEKVVLKNIFHIIRGCIQKFPDWVDNEINNNKRSLRRNTKGYGGKSHKSDSQNSDTTAPSGRELYHLQFSLQAVSPETFEYTLVFLFHLPILSIYLSFGSDVCDRPDQPAWYSNLSPQGFDRTQLKGVNFYFL